MIPVWHSWTWRGSIQLAWQRTSPTKILWRLHLFILATLADTTTDFEEKWLLKLKTHTCASLEFLSMRVSTGRRNGCSMHLLNTIWGMQQTILAKRNKNIELLTSPESTICPVLHNAVTSRNQTQWLRKNSMNQCRFCYKLRRRL